MTPAAKLQADQEKQLLAYRTAEAAGAANRDRQVEAMAKAKKASAAKVEGAGEDEAPEVRKTAAKAAPQVAAKSNLKGMIDEWDD